MLVLHSQPVCQRHLPRSSGSSWQRIPGLLLADDAVIFANTDTEMRDNLATSGAWATSWHMKIEGGEIPVVDQYTYLMEPFPNAENLKQAYVRATLSLHICTF